jgi:hypothetical protein
VLPGLAAAAAVVLAAGTGAMQIATLPPAITESSGAASSSLSDDWFFTHEDSGAPAQFHAVATDGRLLATYVLPDVQARDWEDMARGPDEQGRSSLFLGDIGDNSALRELGLLVHRVPEPRPDPDRTDVQVTTEPPVSFRLRYDDGPGDAETLLVHPRTGRLYVVNKPLGGAAGVYAAPEVLDPDGPNGLTRLGSVNGVQATGTPGGPGIGGVAQLLITGGDVAPDGSRVALRTYTDLYEWPVTGDDLATALQGEPVVTPLPATFQGEAVAYTRDGSALLLTSEGTGAPVHRVPAADLGGRTGPAENGPSAAQEATAPLWRRPVVLAAAAGTAVVLLLALRRARTGPRRRR